MSARGNVIIISSQPGGKFKDIVVSGTPKPGTVMEIETSFAEGGVHKMRAYQPGSDGERRPIAVLLEKDLLGGNITDAYVDGERGRVYYPIPGEELNMLVKNETGTGSLDEFADGELAAVDSGTGKLIRSWAAGSPESEPFQALGALSDVTADVLHPFLFTGY